MQSFMYLTLNVHIYIITVSSFQIKQPFNMLSYKCLCIFYHHFKFIGSFTVFDLISAHTLISTHCVHFELRMLNNLTLNVSQSRNDFFFLF